MAVAPSMSRAWTSACARSRCSSKSSKKPNRTAQNVSLAQTEAHRHTATHTHTHTHTSTNRHTSTLVFGLKSVPVSPRRAAKCRAVCLRAFLAVTIALFSSKSLSCSRAAASSKQHEQSVQHGVERRQEAGHAIPTPCTREQAAVEPHNLVKRAGACAAARVRSVSPPAAEHCASSHVPSPARHSSGTNAATSSCKTATKGVIAKSAEQKQSQAFWMECRSHDAITHTHTRARAQTKNTDGQTNHNHNQPQPITTNHTPLSLRQMRLQSTAKTHPRQPEVTVLGRTGTKPTTAPLLL